jgi:hypothetical protein
MVFEAYNEICDVCNSYYSMSHVNTMLLASNPFVRLKSEIHDQKYNKTNIFSSNLDMKRSMKFLQIAVKSNMYFHAQATIPSPPLI